jgi:hypothetical protein
LRGHQQTWEQKRKTKENKKKKEKKKKKGKKERKDDKNGSMTCPICVLHPASAYNLVFKISN